VCFVAERDWVAWHAPYDDPLSALSERLALVQGHFRGALDRCPPGPITVISMCGGQGRDVIGVLAEHGRRHDVRVTVVERDSGNITVASDAAARAGLTGIDVVEADAGLSDAYRTAVPAAIVLACGVFGNISDDDIARTVAALPGLCAAGATVIWTRHRRSPDLTPTVRRWFEEAGFAEIGFDDPERHFIGVGAHRLVARPRPFVPGQRLFDFVGFDALAPTPVSDRRPSDEDDDGEDDGR
jgi:hypothetical protein